MPREYKRKRLMEGNSLDFKPKKINLEKSERGKTKRRIKKELEQLCQTGKKKSKG